MALKHLNVTLNMANDMNHPRNRDFFINTFTMLWRNGENYNSEDVKAWLIANEHWNPEVAQQAANIVEDVKKGKRFKLRNQDHRYKRKYYKRMERRSKDDMNIHLG